MKFNIIKITLIITAMFALFLACDKDAEVISNFDFVLTETHAETTTVKYPEQTTFNIVPERVVTSTFYEFKYEILNGEGAYLDDEGNQIPKETFTRLSSRNPIFSYSSDKIGEEKARVTIRDNGGITKTVDVLYTIEHNPYSLEFSTPFNETKVKESKPVTLSLFNTGVDKTVTYERAFFILQGAGNLTVADEEQQIELEDFMPIEEGTYNYDISFDEFGESKVMVATKDSNNQIKNDTLTFQVDQIDVDFTATAERNNAFVGQEFNIIFGISEDQGAGGTYQLRYAVDNGEATMNSSDEPLSPGVLYDVETGGFAWNGIANTPGQMGITFILKNENGVELTQQVSIAVINASIGFDAVPLAAEIFVGESVGFNAIITEEPIASPPYSLRFVSSSAGTLTYNGIDYNPGQDIFVDDSNFAFEYNPISVAEHTITFLVENGLGVNASDVESVMVKVQELSFDAIAVASETNLGIPVVINAAVMEQPNHSPPYLVKFESTGTATISYVNNIYSAGQLIQIDDPQFQLEYIPSTLGNHAITLTLNNNIQIQRQDVININVLQSLLSLDVVPTGNEVFLSQWLSFNASISDNPQTNPPYTLSFASTGTGDLRYDGNSYGPGEEIVLNDAQFVFEYMGNSLGNHQITFTAENELDAEGSDVVDIDVLDGTLSLDAVPTGNEVFLSQWLSFNASISDNPQTNPPYTLSFASTGTGDLRYDGNSYGPGEEIVLNDAQFVFEYMGNSLGNHQITFTAENELDAEGSDVVDIDVLDGTLSLDAVPTGNEVFLSQWLSFNASISDNPQTNPPYTLSFASTGTGDLRYDGNSYGPGEEIVINDAQFVFEYMGNSLGNHQITFTAENELDVEGSDVVDIDVLDGTLSLDAVPTGNEVFLSQWLSFNASISDNPQTNPPYTLSFASTGTGDLRYDGNSYGPGEEIVINDAQFVFEYMGNSLGNHQITFTAENELDVEGSDVVGIDVLDATLSFDAVPANANAPIGVPVNFNATISENPLTNPPYTLSFASTGTGTVRYNNANYSSGQDIVINAKQFGFQYTGTTAGNHSITFTATNNLNAEGVDVEAIQIEQSNFNVSSTPSTNPITEGLSYDINHNVSPIAGQQTFQMSYSVNSGSVTMRDQSNGLIQENVLIDVPNGNFDWSVMANSEQDVDITFTIVNNNNVQKQTNVQMDVTSSDFDFTLSYQNNVETGEGVADIQIDLSGDNLFDYELSYSINPNDASVIKENGLVVQQNVPIDVGITDLNFEFVDFTQYSIDISITSSVLPNNPVTKQAIINVVHTPFIFTVSNPNNVDKDNPMDLILALDGSNNLDYTISRSVLDGEGTFNFSNNSVLTQGDNNFRYTPSTINQGEQELRFTATDNFGHSVTIDKVFVVNGPIITSVSTNYLKTGCFDVNNTKERCDIILVLVPTMLVQDDIQELRIRYNNTIEDGVAFAQFFTPNQFIVNVGTIDIENNNNTNDTNVDVQNGDDFEVQIRDSNGMWSDWTATTARNSYGLTFH